MTVTRDQVAKDDQWNLNSLYPSFKEWDEDYKKLIKSESPPYFSHLCKNKGKFKENATFLHETLDEFLQTERLTRKLYTYAHLRHDEDIADNISKTHFEKILLAYHLLSQEISWMEPEILSLDENTLQQYMKSTVLKEYHFYLEKLLRLKPHVLPEREEALLAMAEQALVTSQKAFSAINDADFQFPDILDSDEKTHPLTHAMYGMHIRSQDRTLRKNSFLTMHNKYREFENSLTELLSGQTQKHLFCTRARNYATCLDSALFSKNIDSEVYHSLIGAVHDNISVLHEYMGLRKRLLSLDELHMYDLYVPTISQFDKKYTYQEAEDLVIESLQPLGEEYVETVRKGLKQDRWVDRYENKNKRSGAYSSGCYDSMPYVLMNFRGMLRDVFTLAHEVGHSMHSYLSHKHQPYVYSDYAIFVAEVASTFNEELLMNTLLAKASSDTEKAFLINEKIEDIRATFFRQTMFAEFELLIHTLAEQGQSITPELLKNEFMRLNKFYFGSNVFVDPEVAVEYARIPHFYYNFYVFQYATGISAALALSNKVLTEGAPAVKKYLNFLQSGSSDYPIELLSKAGVDMRSKAPVSNTLTKFSTLVKELDRLTRK